ncbi:hypothetical protein IF2G_01434 [Cordyceps javanica]|nr:hypothetical protein IF2G_01434 [Cordyceps javanica]
MSLLGRPPGMEEDEEEVALADMSAASVCGRCSCRQGASRHTSYLSMQAERVDRVCAVKYTLTRYAHDFRREMSGQGRRHWHGSVSTGISRLSHGASWMAIVSAMVFCLSKCR